MTKLLHVSTPHLASLGAEYRVYADRVEVDVPWLPTIVVPVEEVEAVTVRPPLVVADLFRTDHDLSYTWVALKLDAADLVEHVALQRASGLFRQLRITPQDVHGFVQAVEQARAAHAA